MPKGIRKKVTPTVSAPDADDKFTLSAGDDKTATTGRQKGWRKLDSQPSKKSLILAIFESGVEKTGQVIAELKKQKVSDVSESYINTMKSNWRKAKQSAGSSQPLAKSAPAKTEPVASPAKIDVASDGVDDLQLALFAARNGGFEAVISRLNELSGK